MAMYMPMSTTWGVPFPANWNDKNDYKAAEYNRIRYFSFLNLKSIHGIGANNFLSIYFSAKTRVKQG